MSSVCSFSLYLLCHANMQPWVCECLDVCFCVWGQFPVSYTVSPCLSYSALGGSQRLGGCHPLHYECVAGLPHLLADFQYYGCQSVCGEVLLLLQPDWKGILWARCGQQQIWVLSVNWSELHWGALEERQNQLWQRGCWLPGSSASGKTVSQFLVPIKMVYWLQK